MIKTKNLHGLTENGELKVKPGFDPAETSPDQVLNKIERLMTRIHEDDLMYGAVVTVTIETLTRGNIEDIDEYAVERTIQKRSIRAKFRLV